MKIAVIGPRDSLNNIMKIADEFEKDVQLIEYEGNTLKECIDATNNCKPEVDGILFSGRAIYDVVSRHCTLDICNSYIIHNETSILSILARENFKEHQFLSIDFLDKKIALEVLQSSKIENFEIIGADSLMNESNYINFHLKNFKQHQNVAVFTCFPLVVKELEKQGIPVYRLYATVFSIRNEINNLVGCIHNKNFDDAKISVQIINLQINNQRSTRTEALSKVLEFEQALIPYLQIIKGAIFNFSRNEYIIFSTKGLLTSDKAKNEFYNIITSTKFSVFSGIGIGATAAMAEINANKALDYSLKQTKPSFHILGENGILEGPILHKNILEHSPNTLCTDYSNISSKTGLSQQYLQKISNIIQIQKKDTFCANELAEYLEISNRSARRIIKQLFDGDCAIAIGKEYNLGSGRPQIIYKIKL